MRAGEKQRRTLISAMGAQGQPCSPELVPDPPADVPGGWHAGQVFCRCISQKFQQGGELRFIPAKSYEVGGIFGQKTVDPAPDLPPRRSVIYTGEEITSASQEDTGLGP